jgi:hypothetical protein
MHEATNLYKDWKDFFSSSYCFPVPYLLYIAGKVWEVKRRAVGLVLGFSVIKLRVTRTTLDILYLTACLHFIYLFLCFKFLQMKLRIVRWLC